MSLPAHLVRSIASFRDQPALFYQRSSSERQFFLDQLMIWMDRLFEPDQAPVYYRLRALSLPFPILRRLEVQILRFVRNFIFSPDLIVNYPSNEDWFVYAHFRTLN